MYAGRGLFIKNVFKRFLKSFIVIFSIFVLLLGISLFYVVATYIREVEPLRAEQMILKGASCVYDANGNMIMTLHGDKNREIVKSEDIPKNLKYAFVAIEDKRFYKHSGIDMFRIAGAVTNFFRPGANKYGASTITQQVVKNVTGEDKRSLKRKVQEQWRAVELEKKLTKDQILDLYMNLIYMGRNCYGVQAASKVYFNKDVKDLTLAECASIAGITNAPSYYSPFSADGKENNIKREKIILKEMLNCKFISKDQYEQATRDELKFATEVMSVSTKYLDTQPYFVDQVVTDVKNALKAKGYSDEVALATIYTGGLKIYTTMDLNVQKAMDEVFNNTKYFSIVNKSAGQPQGAMVIIDPKTGYIRALYGGAGEKKGSPFNRATSSKMARQPGSTFKPIAVYAPALNEKKITAATVVDDVPVHMDTNQPSRKYPENYSHNYKGLTTIHDAVRDSVNIVAARVWKEFLGPDLSLVYLKKVGINRDSERYVSLALGGLKDGVNPLQMAAAFAPFANKGVYNEPTTYTQVKNSAGDVILEKKANPSIVYDEGTAFIMTNMLRTAVRYGTGYPHGLIQKGNMPSAGKTGTTSDNKDKWFVGFSPYYVGATWYGYDKPTGLSGNEYSRALVIWHEVMEKVHKNLPTIEFTQPDVIIKKPICIYSGKLPSDACTHDLRGNCVREEYFIKGTEPTEECDVHIIANCCTQSKDFMGRNLLAGSHCPLGSVESRVLVRRKQKYIPVYDGDPYPADWIYECPSNLYCNVHEDQISDN